MPPGAGPSPPPEPLGPGDLVLADFDGTISRVDTCAELMNRLDLPEAWEAEYRWRRGELTAPECMRLQWGLMRLPREEFFALLDSLELDEGFLDLVELCAERQAPLAVLSDGLDLYVYPMLRRLGLQPCPGSVFLPPPPGCLPVFVNHGEWTPEGIRVEFPLCWWECGLCGNCKTAELLALKPGHRRVIYLGDGYSDRCAARHADVVFAKGHLAEYCQAQGWACRPFERLAEVVAELR